MPILTAVQLIVEHPGSAETGATTGRMPEEATTAVNNDPNLIQKIIARYEHEEDEFLRELDDMQAQASQRSSLCDEAPVLGELLIN
ncbi:unnamed protein product [Anisakis simplex]|uniref:Peptide chain release factor 1 n=1 Tax=Anisakis simplex TaxID=6269 RepID=A0A0M3KDI8_ANISI|nr:unnamed protein product [Anisakis simplex]